MTRNVLSKDMKMGARYVLLTFFMFLAYKVTEAEYVVKIKDIGEIAASAIYGSVFGALTLIIRSHFETKPGNDDMDKEV